MSFVVFWSSNSLSLLLDAIAPIVEWEFLHSPGVDDLTWGETICKPLVCAQAFSMNHSSG